MHRSARKSLAVASAFGILAGGVATAGPAAAAGPPEQVADQTGDVLGLAEPALRGETTHRSRED
jgi:hypothetical protein